MLPNSRDRHFTSTGKIFLSHTNLESPFGDLGDESSGSHFLLDVTDIQGSNCCFERLHVFRGRLINHTRASLLVVLLDAFDDS